MTAVAELMLIAWRSVGARVTADAQCGRDHLADLRRIGIATSPIGGALSDRGRRRRLRGAKVPSGLSLLPVARLHVVNALLVLRVMLRWLERASVISEDGATG